MTGETGSQAEQPNTRAAFYIDGFNLYHAVKALKKPYLMWCDLRKMAEIIIPQKTHIVTKVVFFTAYNGKDYARKCRHEKFVRALEYSGVEVVLGHYSDGPRSCKACSHSWIEAEEKESDVNLAIHLIADAYSDVFDHAYLVTADSDQAATAKMMAERFSTKKLTVITPMGKYPSGHIKKYANDGNIILTEDHLEWSLLPRGVRSPDEKNMVIRPNEYDWPQGWQPKVWDSN